MASPQRPLSPHLQIYRPQLTSVLSITHRATGIALGVGTLMLTWWLMALAGGQDSYAVARGFMGSWLGKLLLFGWTVAFFYHLANGIRHLAWDAGWGLDLPRAYATGWATLAATVGLTALAWLLILAK
jgi:succinate dehydrogenase / fumarate reductase cytochrome b subunit